MEDWSTEDYTRSYGGTFYEGPPPGEGVVLLEEAGNRFSPGCGHARGRVEACSACGTCGGGSRRERFASNAAAARGPGAYDVATSDVGNRAVIFNQAWDERPQHYNPNAGEEWARMGLPLPRQTWRGGPPEPAFPIVPGSEAILIDRFAGAPAAAAVATCGVTITPLQLAIFAIILIAILVAILSRLLRLDRRLKKVKKLAKRRDTGLAQT